MTLIELEPRRVHAETGASFSASESSRSARAALADLLLVDDEHAFELPPLQDLLTSLLSIAEGNRKKALLPLATIAAEFAFLRRGQNVLVSHYHTDSSPEVVTLDRRVSLRTLLDATAAAVSEELGELQDPWSRLHAERALARARDVEIHPVDDIGASATRRLGGAIEDPGDKPLVFGFEAAIFANSEAPKDAVSHADVHAMLFGGTLWAWVRGRRIPLCRGPIFLPVQRMVSAIRALIDAASEERTVNVRLRSGKFIVGVRRDRSGDVALTLGSEDEGVVTIPALDLASAALPVLRVAGDLMRVLVSVDRSQSRNLRLIAMREEVRRQRRRVRASRGDKSVVASDPERYRTACIAAHAAPIAKAPTATMRFTERWSAAIDGLDASSTMLCGDRLVLGTPRRIVAIDRERGSVIWQRDSPCSLSFLAGSHLLRMAADGTVELREIGRGEVVLRSRLAPRTHGAPFGMFVGGGSIPPTAVLAEGRDRLCALDLRTGEPRWRFKGRGAGDFRVKRAGRLLLIVCGDGSVHAIDALSGEIAWRHTAERARFCLTPVASGEHVLAISGEPRRGEAELVGIDLCRGTSLFRRSAGGCATVDPICAGPLAIVAVAGGRKGVLRALHLGEAGELRWSVSDPGLGHGGAALAVDDQVLINTPRGTISSLSGEDGSTVWSRTLAHPVTDDVPRRLDPVLRGGALFVPAAAVHVMRPATGTAIGAPLSVDLVPDAMIVDERGWIYVAEESGHLSALAPANHLALVRS